MPLVDTVTESAESMFGEVFGARRTPFSSRPASLRLPSAAEVQAAGKVAFRWDGPGVCGFLFCLEPEDDHEPFLWVARMPTWTAVRDDGVKPDSLIYLASREHWRRDAPGETGRLRDAICPATSLGQDFLYGDERVTDSLDNSSTCVCFPAEGGEYVRLSTRDGVPWGHWGADELQHHPSLLLLDLVEKARIGAQRYGFSETVAVAPS